MKLKLIGLLLASSVVGLFARIFVKLSEATSGPRTSTLKERVAIDAAIEEAVKQGGYRARPAPSSLPN